jgi:hypothetical protein
MRSERRQPHKTPNGSGLAIKQFATGKSTLMLATIRTVECLFNKRSPNEQSSAQKLGFAPEHRFRPSARDSRSRAMEFYKPLGVLFFCSHDRSSCRAMHLEHFTLPRLPGPGNPTPEVPIQSELFIVERLEQHVESLATAQRSAQTEAGSAARPTARQVASRGLTPEVLAGGGIWLDI